jgi:hypothetical protein
MSRPTRATFSMQSPGPRGFAQKHRSQSALSGRLTIAQRFIAGTRRISRRSPVKRTTERGQYRAAAFSRPLHGLDFLSFHPSSELLGYCQSSAARTDGSAGADVNVKADLFSVCRAVLSLMSCAQYLSLFNAISIWQVALSVGTSYEDGNTSRTISEISTVHRADQRHQCRR